MVGEGSRTDFSAAGSDETLMNDGCPFPSYSSAAEEE